MGLISTKNIRIRDKIATGIEIKLPNANLVMAVADKGYLICGYLNMETAEKFGDIACLISGVKTVEELLQGKIVKLSSQATKLGIKLAMTGQEALEIILK